MSHGERVCSAWVMDKCGPASEMRREDAWRVPAPGPGQIRVRVVCAALNPVCARRIQTRLPLRGRVSPARDGARVCWVVRAAIVPPIF